MLWGIEISYPCLESNHDFMDSQPMPSHKLNEQFIFSEICFSPWNIVSCVWIFFVFCSITKFIKMLMSRGVWQTCAGLSSWHKRRICCCTSIYSFTAEASSGKLQTCFLFFKREIQFDYAYTISAWRIRKQVMKSTVLLHFCNGISHLDSLTSDIFFIVWWRSPSFSLFLCFDPSYCCS